MARCSANWYDINYDDLKKAIDYYKWDDMGLFIFYLEKAIPDFHGLEERLTSSFPSDIIQEIKVDMENFE